MNRLVIGCFGAVLALSLDAEELYVGYNANVERSVSAATTQTTARVISAARGTIRKTGDGAWHLSAGALAKSPALDLDVQGGTVVFGAGDESSGGDVAKPLAVLNKALLWLDASDTDSSHFVSATKAETGETYLEKWHDVRETTPESPAYMYAQANLTYTNIGPQTVTHEYGGVSRAAVWFGGHTRGRTMNWILATGNQFWGRTVRNVFGVFGFIDSYGFPFGSLTSLNESPPFHPSNYGNYSIAGRYLSDSAGNIPYSGRFYLTGEWIDPFQTSVRKGWQLFECDPHKGAALIQNFFNDRNLNASWCGYRTGGDYIAEVAVFTNSLTETERLQVEQYLIDKWKLPRSVRNETHLTAFDGTTVQGADATVGPLALEGSGTYENLHDGVGLVAAVSNCPSLCYSPILRAERGAVDLGRAGVVRAESGDTISAVPAPSGTRISMRRTAGVGEIAKDGIEPVRLGEVPSDATRLSVRAGTLALGRLPRSATVVAGEMYVAVTNASFEFMNGAQKYYDSEMLQGTYTTVDGWTIEVRDHSPSVSSAYLVDLIAGSMNKSKDWKLGLPTVDGRMCLMLKRDAAAYSRVRFPAAGRYELAFWSASRQQDNYAGDQVELVLVDGSNVTNVFGHAIQNYHQGRFTEQRHVFDVSAAGEYTLGFRSVHLGADLAMLIDKLTIRKLVGDDTQSWRIPGGDFEAADFTSATYAFKSFSAANTHPDWTFSQTNGWVAGTTPNVGLSTWWMGATYDNYDGGVYFCDSGNGSGSSVQLCFVDNEATASTLFTPPAGSYFVRLKAARRNKYYPKLSATVEIGSGAAQSLGTIDPTSYLLSSYTYATAFTVSDGESVTLTLWRSKDIAANVEGATKLIVDDVELISADNPGIKLEPAGNLVRNWSFESGSGFNESTATATYWTNVGSGTTEGAGASYRGSYNGYKAHFGYDRFDGDAYLLISRTGWAEQEIDFPEAGAYQLRYFTHSRVETLYGTHYFNNWVRTYLCDANGRTNELAWAPGNSTNFVERSVLFSVPKAGTYRLGFSGLCGTDRMATTSSVRQTLIDGVSVVKVDDALMEGYTLPETLDIDVASGATLQLDFAGTNRVRSVRLGGRQRTRVIDAARYPTLINGTGALYVEPRGVMLFVR